MAEPTVVQSSGTHAGASGRTKGSFRVIVVAVFLNSCGFTLIIPVLPFLVGTYVPASEIGPVVGLLTAAYALCQFVAAPVLGAMSDRFGRRPVLLLSLGGSVLGYLVFGIGGALWVLFLGRVVDGLTGGNISTIFAYVADTVKPEERSRAYGLLGAANGVGFIAGPAIGGLTGAFALSLPALVAAALTATNMLWTYFALPESLPRERRTGAFAGSHLNPFAPFSQVLDSPILRLAFAASFLFCIGGAMYQSNLAVFLKDVLAFGPVGVGAVLLAIGVMDIVSQGVLTGRLLPRFGERYLARTGLLIYAAGLLLIALVAFVPSVGLISVAILVVTLGDGLFQPSMGGIIANAAPAAAQGRIQGANQGQQSIARILGPLSAAFFYTLGTSAPYSAAAGILLVAFAILRTMRYQRA